MKAAKIALFHESPSWLKNEVPLQRFPEGRLQWSSLSLLRYPVWWVCLSCEEFLRNRTQRPVVLACNSHSKRHFSPSPGGHRDIRSIGCRPCWTALLSLSTRYTELVRFLWSVTELDEKIIHRNQLWASQVYHFSTIVCLSKSNSCFLPWDWGWRIVIACCSFLDIYSSSFWTIILLL